MSFNRAATRVAPVLLRTATRARHGARLSLPSKVPAVAILIPRRALATETSTHSGSGGDVPPPGFNIKEAQKPLPKDQQRQGTQAKETRSSGAEEMKNQVSIPQDGATAHAKTPAMESSALTELAADKAATGKAEEKKLAKKKEEEKKLTVWQKVKKEAQHYWDGTKLLGTELRISSSLALKMAAGYELTRRENRQVLEQHNIATSFTLMSRIAPANGPGPWPPRPFLRLRHRPFR